MKINMPVTDKEIIFDDTQFMLTKTDPKGVITYANQDCIDVSGFSESELVGSSHNMVRHPDMPVEAFADMWRDLKAGKPWTGMVKNRTKNGDFYWVQANAAPIFDNGVVTGFLSVRRKPSRQQVEAATAAYRLFKEGRASGLSIVHGKVVKDTILNKVKNKIQDIRVGQRLAAIVSIGVVALLVTVAVGLNEINKANNAMKSIHADRLIPTRDLGEIVRLMTENRTQLRTALSEVEVNTVGKKPTIVMNREIAAKSADAIEQNIETISKVWKSYMATYLTPEEKILAEKF